MENQRDDTICAISTPLGEGGIGIVRISGPLSLKILRSIFVPRSSVENFLSHRFYLGKVLDPRTKKVLDEVLAVYMKAPRTYTREDVVEIHTHGGPYVQNRILSVILALGARLAEPGEFTKRAFLNGRIDLVQAESVLGLINSETERELECALLQLNGKLSKKFEALKDLIKESLALAEAQIDFPDEEIEIEKEELISTLKTSLKHVDRLLASYSEGKLIREGYNVLIVGRTNVGKSSLFNEILLKERAIVTPIPGTTRDLIEDVIQIRGQKVRLVDTAGIRDPKDLVEKEGIERVKRRIPHADLILWVVDSNDGLTDEDLKIYEEIKDLNVVGVINKIDLGKKVDESFFSSRGIPYVLTSAVRGDGIDELRELIQKKLSRKSPRMGSVVITSARHKSALEKVRECVERAISGIEKGISYEFVALELRDALTSLGEILGEVYTDEILDEIFSRFCIGK